MLLRAEPRRDFQTSLAGQVRTCLREHLSRINAEVVLTRSCAKCGLEPRQLEARHLERFFVSIRPSLGLYLTPGRVERVVASLSNLTNHDLASPVGHSHADVEIKVEDDIETARTSTLRMARLCGLHNVEAVKCATVVSELARNIFQYASEGVIRIESIKRPRRGLCIVARDHGPGIPNVNEVLSGSHRSATGLGLGLKSSQRLMDDFQIESKPGTGTTITTLKYT